MATPLIRLRTPEVCREAVLLSMEITILHGSALFCYTLLLILQQIYSYTGLILLSVGMIVILTRDHSSDISLLITAVRKLIEIGKQLGRIVGCATNKYLEEPMRNFPDLESRFSGSVAIWTSYVAYAGLLVQVFLRYPISLDTLFAGGFIAVAVSANHTYLFSCMWDSVKRKSNGENLDQIDGRNKIDENEVKEIKAKYDEDRHRWEEEKKDLKEQIGRANAEASKLGEKANACSMFGTFNWD